MDKQQIWAEDYSVAQRVLELGGLWATEAGAAMMQEPDAVAQIRELAHAAVDRLEGRELLGVAMLADSLAGPEGDAGR